MLIGVSMQKILAITRNHSKPLTLNIKIQSSSIYTIQGILAVHMDGQNHTLLAANFLFTHSVLMTVTEIYKIIQSKIIHIKIYILELF